MKYPLSLSEFEDFLTTSIPPILFLNGSRSGYRACQSVPILDDDIAEDVFEEFTLNITSVDEAVAVVLDPFVSVIIQDDDGNNHAFIPVFYMMICFHLQDQPLCCLFSHLHCIFQKEVVLSSSA